MGNTGHRIGKLVFETRASDSRKVSAFNERVRNRFDTIVLPALESALDSIDQASTVIRLDRLEIDLGSFDDDTENLGEKLKVALLAALPDQGPAALSPTGHSAAEELIRFLRTGTLTWAEPGQALAVLTQDVMSWSNADFAALTTRMRILLLRKSAARRLVWQMPTAFVLRVLHTLAEALGIPLPDARAPRLRPDIFLTRPQTEIAYELLQTLVRGQAKSLPPADVQASFSALGGVRATPTEELKTEPQEPESLDVDSEPEPTLNKQQVFAAGAVLLHPFLSAFYDQLGLLDATGQFTNRQSQIRAALATHHLATGAMQAPEPETTVFKLLCGLPLNHPIPRETPVQTTEQDEANDLLHSMIHHWKRLGKTSPDGLRTSFLNRPGLLQKTNDGWLLTVEQRSIDVLLDHLPWTLSRVKTHFMPDLLTVDWR